MAEVINPVVAKIQEGLKHQLAQERSGAHEMGPVSTVLDARDVSEKLGKEKHIRWLNLRNPNKLVLRQREGYTRLSESEGGRVIADEMALFVAPAVVHDRAVAEQKAENGRRLKAHRTEMEALAENTARVLKDTYGISVDPKRLFTDEGE